MPFVPYLLYRIWPTFFRGMTPKKDVFYFLNCLMGDPMLFDRLLPFHVCSGWGNDSDVIRVGFPVVNVCTFFPYEELVVSAFSSVRLRSIFLTSPQVFLPSLPSSRETFLIHFFHTLVRANTFRIVGTSYLLGLHKSIGGLWRPSLRYSSSLFRIGFL